MVVAWTRRLAQEQLCSSECWTCGSTSLKGKPAERELLMPHSVGPDADGELEGKHFPRCKASRILPCPGLCPRLRQCAGLSQRERDLTLPEQEQDKPDSML